MIRTKQRRGLIGAGLAVTVIASCIGESTAPVDYHAQLGRIDPCAADAPRGLAKKCDIAPPPSEDRLPPVASDEMVAPLRLDWTPAGWLLASDPRHAMVLRIDPVGLVPIEGFRTRGKPLGVTALGSSIFVGNADRGTIDVHRTNGGGFTASFGPGAVQHPTDLAADDQAELIFALDGRRREVLVFTPWGDLVQVISGPGTTDDRLVNPTAIGLDPVRQWVLVSDYGSADTGPASLKVFDYAGGLVHYFSGAGTCGMLGCSGGFSTPQGAVVDDLGRIHLPDIVLAKILIIDPASWSITSMVGDRWFFRAPTDLAIGSYGDLFIASNRTGHVRVIRGAGGP